MQAKATDWLKPPLGATLSEYEAVCPRVIVVVVAELETTEKSIPVPVSVTVCELFDALSLIVKVPVLTPPAVGSKNTPMAQLEFTERLLPQELSSPKSEGLAVILAIFSAELPVFVSVTV
jgi:hypothetical protein